VDENYFQYDHVFSQSSSSFADQLTLLHSFDPVDFLIAEVASSNEVA